MTSKKVVVEPEQGFSLSAVVIKQGLATALADHGAQQCPGSGDAWELQSRNTNHHHRPRHQLSQSSHQVATGRDSSCFSRRTNRVAEHDRSQSTTRKLYQRPAVAPTVQDNVLKSFQQPRDGRSESRTWYRRQELWSSGFRKHV